MMTPFRRAGTVIIHRFLILVVLAYCVAPFLWMILTSMLPISDLTSIPPHIHLSELSLSRYVLLFRSADFLGPLYHSAEAASGTTVVTMLLGSLAAYGIARFQFGGRKTLLVSMMLAQMVPVIALAVPLFILLRSLHLIDTVLGLILTYTAFILPIVIWLLVGFFGDIPASLEKAAKIDGCNRWQIMWRIILPLSANSLVAAGAFAFIAAWSDFFLALVLTYKNATTLPVRAADFVGVYSVDYRSAATAGVIATLPVLLLTLVFQRWIVRGLTEGALKG